MFRVFGFSTLNTMKSVELNIRNVTGFGALLRFRRCLACLAMIDLHFFDVASSSTGSGQMLPGCKVTKDLRTGECLRTIQGHSRPIRTESGEFRNKPLGVFFF